MSSGNETHTWLDNWWPVLVIGYGAVLAAILASTAALVKQGV